MSPQPLPEQPEQMPGQPWIQAEQPPWTQPQPQWGPQQNPSSSPLPSWDSAQPNSGGGYWTPGPTSAPPQSGAPSWNADPHDAANAAPRPATPGRGRRTGLIAALIALPIAFGVGGYFLGTAQGKPAAEDVNPSPSASLPLFQSTQLTINRTKLGGDLSGVAGPWLSDVGGCTASTDRGGPKLPVDEKEHVFCRYGGVAVHFASYKDAAKRDSARAWRQQLGLQNGSVAQGMELPQHKTGTVSGATGTYVEYALKGTDGRVYCGLWWDREGESSAVYLEALCQEDLGGSWAPLRDLWSRHS
jgi:hypothetical protein